jgi:protein phosphatase
MYYIVEVGSFSFPKPNKEVNEDFLLHPTYDLDSNIIFAIADGVGSSNNANKISECAINAINKTLKAKQFSMESAFQDAKAAIDELSSINDEYSQSATTLTVVHIQADNVVIGHVGDCRAYAKKNNKLQQLTKDHTRYQELIDEGELSVRKLQQHKERLSSVLTNALTKSFKLRFDIINIPIENLIENGYLNILLMSDGAYNHWQKKAKFSENTMNSPSAFINSLRKRIEKDPSDDFTCLSVKVKT